MARPKKGSKAGIDQVLRALDRGEIDPVYVFHGPNTLLIEQALERLKLKIVGESADFAYQVLRGGEIKGQEIVNAARTVPMLATEQLIVVRRADALSADDQAALLPYITAPNPSTCLVLVATKIDKRLKFFAKANKLGLIFDAAAIAQRDLTTWIIGRSSALGLRMAPNVAHILGDSTGTDAATVEDALERLRLYLGDRSEAREDDIEAVVSESRVRSVFEMTDALGQRNTARALRTLSNMLHNREAPLRLLATLATHMRRLVIVKDLLDQISPQSPELASELGVPPFLARKLADQSHHFSKPELRRAMLRLAQTDLELKSARRSDDIILEEMVFDLCLETQRPRRRAFC